MVRDLARGGMGVVYLARAEGAVGFAKPVVVKVIQQEYTADRRIMGMFAREAQILQNLRDPGIVDVVDFQAQDGKYVMVLEYVHGYHLDQWRRYLDHCGRQIPTEIALQLTVDVLRSLHHAHTARHPDGESMHIVHRDVSPSNIMLEPTGRVRLLDFGVGRMRGGDTYQTEVKGFVGKYCYVAPEIFSGMEATAQSDLYACGVVLHEMLVGHNVFRATHRAATLNRVLNHEPEPVSAMRDDVPEAVDEALGRALAKSREQRYQTALEFANVLRSLLTRPEHDIHADLADLLQRDFGEEMAKVLGIESLAERDRAWRREHLSVVGRPATDFEPTVIHPHEHLHADEGDSPDQNVATPGDTVAVPTPWAARVRHAASERHQTDSSPRTVAASSGSTSLLTPAPAASGPDAPTLEPAPSGSASGARSDGRRALIGGVLLAVLAACAAAFMVGRSGQKAKPAPHFAVVQQPVASDHEAFAASGAGSVEGTRAGESEADAPAQGNEGALAAGLPESAAQSDQPRPAVHAAGSKGSQSTTRTDTPARVSDGESLTRAFRRRQASVRRCFVENGAPSEHARVEIEFTVRADGRVLGSRVLPKTLASTALGACIKRVAERTRFPRQNGTVAFSIPVTARLREVGPGVTDPSTRTSRPSN